MHVAILYAGSVSRDMGGTSERVLQIAEELRARIEIN
jgi:hypothetical protein